MEEWKIFLTIGEILALFFLVGKPILTLNNTMTSLATTLNELKKDHDEQKEKSSATHKEFYKHLGEHDLVIQDHEHRIKHLEGK